MSTQALIRRLVDDARRPVLPLVPLMAAALAGGAALSFALFRLLFEPRADFALALHGHAFPFKLGVVTLLAVTSAALLGAAARPQPLRRVTERIALAPLVLGFAVVAEFVFAPAGYWSGRLINRDTWHCLAAIPLLSMPPAICLFVALRHGAPASASRSGAIAGLAAGGIGASFYALACPEDSPLFIALWYTLAIGCVTASCAVLGRRWLRW